MADFPTAPLFNARARGEDR